MRTWQRVRLGSTKINLISQVREACNRQTTERVRSVTNEARHKLVSKNTLSPMTIPRTGTTVVFNRDPSRTYASSNKVPILLHSLRASKGWISTTGSAKKVFMRPYGTDTENVSHFVGDNVIESSIRFHISEITRIERHFSFRWQERSGSRVRRSQKGRTCLPKNVPDSIYVSSLGEDQHVVYYFSLDLHRG